MIGVPQPLLTAILSLKVSGQHCSPDNEVAHHWNDEEVTRYLQPLRMTGDDYAGMDDLVLFGRFDANDEPLSELRDLVLTKPGMLVQCIEHGVEVYLAT
jgi:hypothetical protein